ncbi:unnamed protein product [Rotaria sp. Silwood2]|nr:unnamed protein product [Rotaria sp. Silwood2]
MLVRYKAELYCRISTLPLTYRIQLQNLLNHLLHIDQETFKINYRESYIFTYPTNTEKNDTNLNLIRNTNASDLVVLNDDELSKNVVENTSISSTTLKQLINTANHQQKSLIDFMQTYLDYLLKHSRRPREVSKPKPFHIVVNGLAGSGKSYVISIIEKMLIEYCIAESATVSHARKNFGLLKMAHTGKAALNIHGSTIHSALEICPDRSSSPNKINSFKLYTLRNRLHGLLLIIIDEISLVSYSLLQKINKRLNEIFQKSHNCDSYFGNIPVIVFGDMAQIEPVAAKQVFYRPSGELFSLWHDLFRSINFDINMRQGDDRVFFDCLCRMRIGCLDDENELLIKSRSISPEDNPEGYKQRLQELHSSEFENAVYAYGLRKLTNLRNLQQLRKHSIESKNPIFMINALDRVAMTSTPFFKSSKTSHKICKINLKPSTDENDCGSMYQRIPICVGARVLIRRNIDVGNYVVNGTEAVVKEIVWENPKDFLAAPLLCDDIFSTFTNVINTKLPKYVELELFNGKTYKLEPQETRFNDMNKIMMTRLQLPLALGYAITIHRSQCMTYPKLVVDLSGKYWKPGMFYTILSRTRHITDIIILAYDRKSFKVSREGLQEIERLQRLEKEHPIKIDDYLSEKTCILDSNFSSDSCFTDIKNIDETFNDNSYYSIRTRCQTNENVVNKQFDMFHDGMTPEGVIICERQERLFCGRHALRALLQNIDIFDDTYLISVGEQLATDELFLIQMDCHKACNWCGCEVNASIYNDEHSYCSLTCKTYYKLYMNVETILELRNTSVSSDNIEKEWYGLFKIIMNDRSCLYANRRDNIGFEIGSLYQIYKLSIQNGFKAIMDCDVFEHLEDFAFFLRTETK